VTRVQIVERVAPVAAIDQIVPVGDLVVYRTARRAGRQRAVAHAIRNAAIHAARRLTPRRLLGERNHELLEMADAIGGRLVAPVLPIDFQKPRDLAHSCSVMPGLVPGTSTNSAVIPDAPKARSGTH